MIPFPVPWRLVGAAAGVLAIIGLAYFAYNSVYDAGFYAGKVDRTAYYEPILRAAEAEALRAEGRARAQEEAMRAADRALETQHAQFQKTLADRSSASERRINDLLRSAQAARNSCRVPTGSATASVPDGRAEGPERLAALRTALAADFAAAGADFESDANELLDWQRRAATDAVR